MNNEPWWKPSLELFARLSSLIAIPVILAVFLGKWLDQKYQTEPWLFLGCVGVAFTFSMFGLIKTTFTEYKKITDTQADTKDYEERAIRK